MELERSGPGVNDGLDGPSDEHPEKIHATQIAAMETDLNRILERGRRREFILTPWQVSGLRKRRH
jgi:hypothetical protein